jgi:hypothetical protein
MFEGGDDSFEDFGFEENWNWKKALRCWGTKVLRFWILLKIVFICNSIINHTIFYYEHI